MISGVGAVGFNHQQNVTALMMNDVIGVKMLRKSLDSQSAAYSALLKAVEPIEGQKGTRIDVDL